MGSKGFTESVILGEAATHLLRDAKLETEHRRELGGTRILWSGLLSGELDVYPEYTGTIRQEIFGGKLGELAELEPELAKHGVRATKPFGFSNSYALGMSRARSQELGLETMSALVARPELKLGFSSEFMDRKDGWPALRDRYGLKQTDVRGLDHDLAYRGLKAGDIDVIDLYTTDAEIEFYDLAVLVDDRKHFPSYQALFLYRADLPESGAAALARLEGKIDEQAMVKLNSAVKLRGRTESEVAAELVASTLGVKAEVESDTLTARLLRATKEHSAMVAIALILSVLLAVPIGIAAAKLPRFGRVMLGVVGVLQTIPSLALLVVLIPVLGLGETTAIAALVLYGLLPIVRSTHTGLTTIPGPLQESALALGLSPWARLRRVELPLALPAILSGIQTSAVIAVGTATLGALIGAGGFGQAILTGVRLDRTSLILEGAVPAAGMALVVQGLFELLERWLIPKGLRT